MAFFTKKRPYPKGPCRYMVYTQAKKRGSHISSFRLKYMPYSYGLVAKSLNPKPYTHVGQ